MTTATQTTRPVLPEWGTWKTHGHAAQGMWYGNDRRYAASQGVLVTIEPDGRGGITISSADRSEFYGGHSTVSFGAAHRFWLAQRQPGCTICGAQPQETTEVRHYSDGDSIAVSIGIRHEDWCETLDADEETPAYPTEDGHAKVEAIVDAVTGRKCLCGCGQAVATPRSRRTRSEITLFRQGHDAKLVSKLAADVKSGIITRAQAGTDKRLSSALSAKLLRVLDNAGF